MASYHLFLPLQPLLRVVGLVLYSCNWLGSFLRQACDRSDITPFPEDKITKSGSRSKKYFLDDFFYANYLLSQDSPGWHQASFVSQTSAEIWRGVDILADYEYARPIPILLTSCESPLRRRYVSNFVG